MINPSTLPRASRTALRAAHVLERSFLRRGTFSRISACYTPAGRCRVLGAVLLFCGRSLTTIGEKTPVSAVTSLPIGRRVNGVGCVPRSRFSTGVTSVRTTIMGRYDRTWA